MKKIIMIISCCLSLNVYSQSDEIKQLLLDVEKLMQFKKILKDMYDGYKIIHSGYTTIRDISSGNFKLHKNFLDALMDVSPSVRNYKRIPDIINYQLQIVRLYRGAFNQFKDDHNFTPKEIQYMGKVYTNLFNETLKNLDELAMVITAGKLRMSDDERLKAIDRIYGNVEDQFSFLQDFNTSTSYLSLQRQNEKTNIEMSKRIYGF
jgi:DNA repair ATPase RecN